MDPTPRRGMPRQMSGELLQQINGSCFAHAAARMARRILFRYCRGILESEDDDRAFAFTYSDINIPALYDDILQHCRRPDGTTMINAFNRLVIYLFFYSSAIRQTGIMSYDPTLGYGVHGGGFVGSRRLKEFFNALITGAGTNLEIINRANFNYDRDFWTTSGRFDALDRIFTEFREKFRQKTSMLPGNVSFTRIVDRDEPYEALGNGEVCYKFSKITPFGDNYRRVTQDPNVIFEDFHYNAIKSAIDVGFYVFFTVDKVSIREEFRFSGSHVVLIVACSKVDGRKQFTLKNTWGREWGENGLVVVREGELQWMEPPATMSAGHRGIFEAQCLMSYNAIIPTSSFIKAPRGRGSNLAVEDYVPPAENEITDGVGNLLQAQQHRVGQWLCDGRGYPGGCRSGNSDILFATDSMSWHSDAPIHEPQGGYDLCTLCVTRNRPMPSRYASKLHQRTGHTLVEGICRYYDAPHGVARSSPCSRGAECRTIRGGEPLYGEAWGYTWHCDTCEFNVCPSCVYYEMVDRHIERRSRLIDPVPAPDQEIFQVGEEVFYTEQDNGNPENAYIMSRNEDGTYNISVDLGNARFFDAVAYPTQLAHKQVIPAPEPRPIVRNGLGLPEGVDGKMILRALTSEFLAPLIKCYGIESVNRAFIQSVNENVADINNTVAIRRRMSDLLHAIHSEDTCFLGGRPRKSFGKSIKNMKGGDIRRHNNTVLHANNEEENTDPITQDAREPFDSQTQGLLECSQCFGIFLRNELVQAYLASRGNRVIAFDAADENTQNLIRELRREVGLTEEQRAELETAYLTVPSRGGFRCPLCNDPKQGVASTDVGWDNLPLAPTPGLWYIPQVIPSEPVQVPQPAPQPHNFHPIHIHNLMVLENITQEAAIQALADANGDYDQAALALEGGAYPDYHIEMPEEIQQYQPVPWQNSIPIPNPIRRREIRAPVPYEIEAIQAVLRESHLGDVTQYASRTYITTFLQENNLLNNPPAASGSAELQEFANNVARDILAHQGDMPRISREQYDAVRNLIPDNIRDRITPQIVRVALHLNGANVERAAAHIQENPNHIYGTVVEPIPVVRPEDADIEAFIRANPAPNPQIWGLSRPVVNPPQPPDDADEIRRRLQREQEENRRRRPQPAPGPAPGPGPFGPAPGPAPGPGPFGPAPGPAPGPFGPAPVPVGRYPNNSIVLYNAPRPFSSADNWVQARIINSLNFLGTVRYDIQRIDTSEIVQHVGENQLRPNNVPPAPVIVPAPVPVNGYLINSNVLYNARGPFSSADNWVQARIINRVDVFGRVQYQIQINNTSEQLSNVEGDRLRPDNVGPVQSEFQVGQRVIYNTTPQDRRNDEQVTIVAFDGQTHYIINGPRGQNRQVHRLSLSALPVPTPQPVPPHIQQELFLPPHIQQQVQLDQEEYNEDEGEEGEWLDAPQLFEIGDRIRFHGRNGDVYGTIHRFSRNGNTMVIDDEYPDGDGFVLHGDENGLQFQRMNPLEEGDFVAFISNRGIRQEGSIDYFTDDGRIVVRFGRGRGQESAPLYENQIELTERAGRGGSKKRKTRKNNTKVSKRKTIKNKKG